MSKRGKTVFLDRDGVLIRDVHYLSHLKQIKIYPDAPEGLRRLKEAGFKLIVITNQSGVARGYFNEDFVRLVFEELNRRLTGSGASLDAMYYCPHHPDGYPPLNIKCDCRKPAVGLIDKARRDFNSDNSCSYMIGDKVSDIELAANAGLKGILLKTGYGREAFDTVAERYPQTPVFESFSHAADFIVRALKRGASA